MNRINWLALFGWAGVSLGLLGPSHWGRARGQAGVVQLGALNSRTPADWVEEKPDKALRYKQYRLEAVGDDKDSARLTVDFLGNRKSTAGERVKRWKEMFLLPERRNMDDVAKVLELEVSAAKATYLDVRGDYKGIPGNHRTPRQNFRLLGVYFDAPEGRYLIHLFGPADTVEFYRRGFEHWVKGFK